ncbi:unnamed protein product [Effrenium voratum]|uniref:Ion transport domain-containing protein n=1 Tax=Effrenium voratum TaxID=2562239 RepID=A0AA36J512_9DINO|nr:unnamed protein product [Effrenium voratum]
MPKPTVWAARIERLLEVVEEEQRALVQLASHHHEELGRSLQRTFSRIEDLELVKSRGNPASLVLGAHEDVPLAPLAGPLAELPEWVEPDDQEDRPVSKTAVSTRTTTTSAQNTGDLLGLDGGGFADRGKTFTDMLAGMLVLLNSLVMLVELELEGRALGAQLGVDSGPQLKDVAPIFRTLDAVFVFVFLLELVVRMCIERKRFVYDAANWFDTILVVAGLADMFVGLPVSDTEDKQSIVMLRMVRALKSLRAIRLVRTFRFFRGLRMLVKACYCFLPSLAWSMVLLLVFMWMATLVLGNLLQDFILDATRNLDDRLWIWNRYGTAYRAMYTLYEITFAGNWPTNVRPVLEKVSHAYVFIYLLYVTIIVFAAIRVISAVFLKDTLEAARNDDESLVVERLKNKAKYVRKLQDLFCILGGSEDGMITEERLAEILLNPKAIAYFQTLDVDVTESAALFSLLDNGDGEITLEEFIDGILRCKGPARAIDQVVPWQSRVHGSCGGCTLFFGADGVLHLILANSFNSFTSIYLLIIGGMQISQFHLSITEFGACVTGTAYRWGTLVRAS